MESFRSILVDIDATAKAHPALERAILLARRSGATLTVVDVMTVAPYAHHRLPEQIQESLMRDRHQQLARVAREIRDVHAEAKLLVGRPATALIEEVLRSNHDVVMRSHARDLTASGPRPFGVVDLELLRKCPSPVLLVRHGQPTAVPFGEATVRLHATGDQFAAYLESARQRAASTLAHMARSFATRFDEKRTVLRRGEPQDVIPEFVVSEGIDILVMGTVARGGIPGMFIGNTAERVLRKLPCSVLTAKPDGFVSPVRLETA